MEMNKRIRLKEGYEKNKKKMFKKHKNGGNEGKRKLEKE